MSRPLTELAFPIICPPFFFHLLNVAGRGMSTVIVESIIGLEPIFLPLISSLLIALTFSATSAVTAIIANPCCEIRFLFGLLGIKDFIVETDLRIKFHRVHCFKGGAVTALPQ